MVLLHLDTVYVTRRSYMFIPKTLNMVPEVPLFSTHIKRQTLALSNVYIYIYIATTISGYHYGRLTYI